MKKILIIRFSSFGDVLQCLSVAGALKREIPESEIHWVTRKDFAPLVGTHPDIERVWVLPRSEGIRGLWRLAHELKAQRFSHVYDAHNNLRSHVLGWVLSGVLSWRIWLGRLKLLRRPIYRWRRFLLFRFRINLFPQPFNGQRDLLAPLGKWGLNPSAPPPPQLVIPRHLQEKMLNELGPVLKEPFLALAPSAAYPLKRWPLSHWKRLIALHPGQRMVVLGGPEDEFLKELKAEFPEQVVDLVGRLSLLESAAVVSLAKALVANDTGLLHVAEQIGKPCIALMGPAPFGFPSREATRILELDLPCRPCSKHGQGPCVNPEYQKCLAGISPELVAETLKSIWNRSL